MTAPLRSSPSLDQEIWGGGLPWLLLHVSSRTSPARDCDDVALVEITGRDGGTATKKQRHYYQAFCLREERRN